MKKCEYCAEEVQDDARKCKHCGEWLEKNEKQTKIKQAGSQLKKESQKLEGFSGWLALFGLGIFANPIIIVFSIISESGVYDDLGIFLNFLIIIAYIWLNYLMVKRRKVFKNWFLGIGIAQIILNGLVAIGANSDNSFSQSELSDANALAVRTLFYVVIWSLYLWNSKRAKNTFIN